MVACMTNTTPLNSSVIIPCDKFNPFLESLFNSLLCQTVPFKKIIIVDNNINDDRFFSLVKKFNFDLIKCKQQGSAYARNKGLELVSSEYVAFLDSDVNISKDWNELMLQSFKNKNVIASQSCLIPSSKKNNNLQKYRHNKKKILTNKTFNDVLNIHHLTILNTAACMVNTKVLKMIGGFEQSLARYEDLDIALKIEYTGKIEANTKAKAQVFFEKGHMGYLKRSFLNGKYSVLMDRLWGEKVKTNYKIQLKLAGSFSFFYALDQVSFILGRALNKNVFNQVAAKSKMKTLLIKSWKKTS